MPVEQIADLDIENLKVRQHQRPAGYSANTRVHMGRLCVPLLNDTGATCACITKESKVFLINHTMCMLVEGKLEQDDYNFPLVQLYKYSHSANLKGAPLSGKMTVE